MLGHGAQLTRRQTEIIFLENGGGVNAVLRRRARWPTWNIGGITGISQNSTR